MVSRKRMILTIAKYLGYYLVIQGVFTGLTILIFRKDSSMGDIVFKVGTNIIWILFVVMSCRYYVKNR